MSSKDISPAPPRANQELGQLGGKNPLSTEVATAALASAGTPLTVKIAAAVAAAVAGMRGVSKEDAATQKRTRQHQRVRKSKRSRAKTFQCKRLTICWT